MHAILAHLDHLAERAMDLPLLRVLSQPLLWPPAAALAVAAACRMGGVARTSRGVSLAVCGAVLAGWLVLNPRWAGWPEPPVARLPGLALILLGEAWLRTRARPAPGWLLTPAAAALAAWWLRGAPGGGPAILACMPVFLGLAAALPLARRLARGDDGWGGVAAGLVLAAGLLLTGAAVHWARAAVVPAAAALALLGIDGAAPAVAGGVVMVAAAAMVASDRGRLVPVDTACVAPLLAWLVAARLQRPKRAGGAAAGAPPGTRRALKQP